MPYLRPALPYLLLVVVTFAAYWNAWPDTLVLDDKLFVGHERFADLSRLPDFFGETVWSVVGVNETLYRPLLMVSIAIDAALFADRVAAYHLVNVFLHVLATLLVYLLLLRLLSLAEPRDESAELIALLAALVFGVHPIHAEVVNSIFNRSTLFAAIGMAAGLWWLLRHFEARPALAWTGIWLAYWFVLFSRETGIVLPALAVALVWIYSNGGLREKVLRCLPALLMAVPLLVYLAMRAHAVSPPLPSMALGAGEPGDLLGVTDLVAPGRLLEFGYLLQVAGVWLDGLRLTLWPRPLLLVHPDPDEVLRTVGLFVHMGLVAAALIMYRRKRYGLITGLAIFYITLLPASRLFGSADSLNLAERYLYEPSIGLAVLLAFGLRYLLRRGDRLVAAAPAVLAVFLLTPITWARNADWSNEVALLEHDYRHGVRMQSSLRMLTSAYLLEHNAARAVEVCRENEDGPWGSGQMSVHCGTAYAMSGDAQKAEQAFLRAAGSADSRTLAHSNLARLYMNQGWQEAARAQFQMAIESEVNPAIRAYREGLMLVQLFPGERDKLLEARAHFEEALRLQPRLTLAINALEQVDRSLDQLP
jgi:tetratricopeptide (TPR) repeat protein